MASDASFVNKIQSSLQDTTRLDSENEDNENSDDCNDENEQRKKLEEADSLLVCLACSKKFDKTSPGCDWQFSKLCTECYNGVDGNKKLEPLLPSHSSVIPFDDPAIAQTQHNKQDIENDGEDDPKNGEDDPKDVNAAHESVGKTLGAILANISKMANPSDRYIDIPINGQNFRFNLYVDPDAHGRRPGRVFFKTDASPTPLLYGWKHFQAFYNSVTKRGWLAHCALRKVLMEYFFYLIQFSSILNNVLG